jgi:hypothetical protein
MPAYRESISKLLHEAFLMAEDLFDLQEVGSAIANGIL